MPGFIHCLICACASTIYHNLYLDCYPALLAVAPAPNYPALAAWNTSQALAAGQAELLIALMAG